MVRPCEHLCAQSMRRQEYTRTASQVFVLVSAEGNKQDGRLPRQSSSPLSSFGLSVEAKFQSLVPCLSRSTFLLAVGALWVDITLSISLRRSGESDCRGAFDSSESSSRFAKAQTPSQCLKRLVSGKLRQTKNCEYLDILVRSLSDGCHSVRLRRLMWVKFRDIFPCRDTHLRIESLAV